MGEIIYTNKFKKPERSEPIVHDPEPFKDWLPWQKAIAVQMGHDPRLFIGSCGGVQLKGDSDDD